MSRDAVAPLPRSRPRLRRTSKPTSAQLRRQSRGHRGQHRSTAPTMLVDIEAGIAQLRSPHRGCRGGHRPTTPARSIEIAAALPDYAHTIAGDRAVHSPTTPTHRPMPREPSPNCAREVGERRGPPRRLRPRCLATLASEAQIRSQGSESTPRARTAGRADRSIHRADGCRARCSSRKRSPQTARRPAARLRPDPLAGSSGRRPCRRGLRRQGTRSARHEAKRLPINRPAAGRGPR